MAVHETARKLTLAGLAFQWEIELALLGLQCVCHLIITDALTSGHCYYTCFTDEGLKFMEAK